MKVIVEHEDGRREELAKIKEMKAIQGNARALVVQTECMLRGEEREKMEREIEGEIGIPALVVDGRVKALYIIP